ncbi:hypothetical protein ACFX15_012650 [Malus domestica]
MLFRVSGAGCRGSLGLNLKMVFMALASNMQKPQESFFRPLQFCTNAVIPRSVISLQPQSLRRVRFLQRIEIRTEVSSSRLINLQSY